MKLFLAAVSLLLVSSPTSLSAEPQTYPIRLYSFGFQPEPIVLRAGVPVTLVFTNTAGMAHEFSARGFFRASRVLSGAISPEGSVELGKHKTATVTLIPARGTYEAHCGHFMHKQLGMQTTIYVE